MRGGAAVGVLCSVVFTASSLLSLVWHRHWTPSSPDTDEADPYLASLVSSLQAVQSTSRLRERTKRGLEDRVVQLSYPWLTNRKTLRHYFTGPPTDEGRYGTSAFVFVNHHRTAEGSLLRCLEDIARENSLAMSPHMSSDTRYDWDTNEALSERHRSKIDMHRGQYSFGVCDNQTKDCSYVFMLRDPLERAISSYQYCQTALADELCGVDDAREVSLRDWIVKQGSLAFQQLTFNPEHCVESRNDSVSAAWTPPCWHEHKLWLEALDPNRRRLLLNHVIANMDKWFSVVGILDDMDTFTQAVNHVHKLPFPKCDRLKNIDTDGSTVTNSANKKKRKELEEESYDNNPSYVKYDFAVKIALEPDYEIYQKVKDLNKFQKQLLSNKVK